MKQKNDELLQKMARQLDHIHSDLTDQGGRINSLCERLGGLERLVQKHDQQLSRAKLTTAATKVKADLHDRQIAQLKEEVSRLKQTSAIWRGDGRVALDRDASYRGFRRIRIEPRRALQELDVLGILICDGSGKRTALVRPSGKAPRRAVVVREDA